MPLDIELIHLFNTESRRIFHKYGVESKEYKEFEEFKSKFIDLLKSHSPV